MAYRGSRRSILVAPWRTDEADFAGVSAGARIAGDEPRRRRSCPPGGAESEEPMKRARFGFALEYVKDIEAAKRFYVDVVGLEVKRQAPQFVQFEGFAIASDQPMGSAKQRELYWLVDDAEAAFDDARKKAQITMPLKQLSFGKVFAIKGAAGQPCYLVQFAADRPSRQVESRP
jgi:predicted enzyme related to lactoylglutathione lyase